MPFARWGFRMVAHRRKTWEGREPLLFGALSVQNKRWGQRRWREDVDFVSKNCESLGVALVGFLHLSWWGETTHAHVRKQRQNPPPHEFRVVPESGPSPKIIPRGIFGGKATKRLKQFWNVVRMWQTQEILLTADNVRGFGAHSGVQPQKKLKN